MAADSKLEIAIQLTAIDNMTAQIRKSLNGNGSALQNFSTKANAISAKAAQIGRTTGLMGAALAAPIIYATKAAIDFEGAMADVAKVANVDKQSSTFKTLGSDALKLSGYLATNANDVAKLYSNLIAGGTSVSQLKQVATIAGEAAVAFEISQEAAGESFSAMKNAMGLTIAETKKAFDATNAISNSFGGKASDLLTFMSGGGASVARTLKATAPEMQAFGRAMTMSGVSAEEAGTVMNRFRVGLYNNAEAMKIFNSSGGGSTGMLAIFQKAKDSGDPFKWFQDRKFGQYASQLSLLAGNGDKLGKMLKFVSKEQNYLNSSNQEFNSRMDTAGKRLEKAKIGFQNVAIKAGTALLPVLTKLLNTVTPFIEKISNWITKNPELTSTILKITAGLSALLLTVSGMSFGISGLFKVIAFGASVMPLFAGGIGGVTAAWKVLDMATKTNVIVLAISLIAAGAFLIWKNWDKIKAFFISLWAGIKAIFWKVIAWIKEWGILFLGPIGFIIKYWGNIVGFFKGFGNKMFNAGKNIIKSLWEGMKTLAMKPIELIKSIFSGIGKLFGFGGGGSSSGQSIKPLQMGGAGKTINPRSGGSSMAYSPNVTIQGGSPTAKEDFKKILQDHSQDMFKIMKEQERKNGRAVLS